MKRLFAWLALPLVLGALMLGAKWRADHPTPTKEDLELRALILQSSSIEVLHKPHYYQKIRPYKSILSTQELKPLSDSFFVLSKETKLKELEAGLRGATIVFCRLAKPRKDGVIGVSVVMSVDNKRGVANIVSDHLTEFDLHPVTIKRWIEILLADPRVGPEFRVRMKEYKRPR